jgi:hypothetical protein
MTSVDWLFLGIPAGELFIVTITIHRLKMEVFIIISLQ